VGTFARDLWTNVFAAASTGPLVWPIAALGLVAAIANLAVLGWGLRRLVRQAWPGHRAGLPRDQGHGAA
jgi:hypothetical protein